MLHGEIKVNNREIGKWSAIRKEPVNPETAIFRYECRVHYRSEQGYLHDVQNFDVYHAYADGALVLTAKVLQAADRQHIQDLTYGR